MEIGCFIDIQLTVDGEKLLELSTNVMDAKTPCVQSSEFVVENQHRFRRSSW